MGRVMMRRETRCSTSTKGMMIRSPGSRVPRRRPSRNSTPFSYCLTILIASARTMRARRTTIRAAAAFIGMLGSCYSGNRRWPTKQSTCSCPPPLNRSNEESRGRPPFGGLSQTLPPALEQSPEADFSCQSCLSMGRRAEGPHQCRWGLERYLGSEQTVALFASRHGPGELDRVPGDRRGAGRRGGGAPGGAGRVVAGRGGVVVWVVWFAGPPPKKHTKVRVFFLPSWSAVVCTGRPTARDR